MAAKKYKTWGIYTQQTVCKSKEDDKDVVIRAGDSKITVYGDEVDSLIVALLEIRGAK